jgi:hypothetical protein
MSWFHRRTRPTPVPAAVVTVPVPDPDPAAVPPVAPEPALPALHADPVLRAQIILRRLFRKD